MYQLVVFHPGERTPRVTVSVARAADVLERIPELLAAHDGCEHIVVMSDTTRLFAVDCHGNRLP